MKTMSIQRFNQLIKDYNRAYKRGDAATLRAVEAEIGEIGYELFVRDGVVYIRNKAKAEGEDVVAE